MIALRLVRIVLHLLQGMATCAFIFPIAGARTKEALTRSWSRKLLALCKVAPEVVFADGASVAPRALIVANHVSWLDIFVINAMQPCRFVAKADIRSWPLIGWLCDKTGTIFIARGKLRDVRRIFEGLVKSLHAGEHVAFFPEGTTAPQGTLLPFHANLFEAAIDAAVPVQPYALRYAGADGNVERAVDFIGEMTFVQSIFAILRAGRITATLTVLPVIPVGQDAHRRELADAARVAVAAALGVR